jgi:hypothetical protein
MKVAIDLTGLCRVMTGTERYSLEMARHLLTRERGIQFSLLFRKSVPSEFRSDEEHVHVYLSPFRSQLLTEQLWIPFVLHRLQPDLVHFPFFPPSPFLVNPFVINVYDANLWLHPETLSLKTRFYTKPLIERALLHAKRVFIIADFYKHDVIAMGRVRPDRVVNVGKGGISADGMAEVGPDGPGAVLGAGARRNDTGVECCPEQTEVSADCIVL